MERTYRQQRAYLLEREHGPPKTRLMEFHYVTGIRAHTSPVAMYRRTCAGLSELWLIARLGLKVAAFFTALSTSCVLTRRAVCLRRSHSSCRSTNDNPDRSTIP